MRLKGPRFALVLNALLEAYTLDTLKSLWLIRHERVLAQDVDVRQPLRAVFFDLLSLLEREGWTREFLDSTLEDAPRNMALRSAYDSVYGGEYPAQPEPPPARFVQQPSGPALEKIVDVHSLFLDPSALIVSLQEQTRRVCRVEIPGVAYGTGFLISENQVLTNFHVIEAVHAGTASPDKVTLRFDYSTIAGEVQEGRTYKLAPHWLDAFSPYAPSDTQVDPIDLPTRGQLDFAILRLEGSPGAPNDRGFIKMPGSEPAYDSLMTLHILQHPSRETIKLASKIPATVGINANQTRFRYDVSTLPGSSGAPIFNHHWHLIGLHHVGDPDSSIGHKPEFNQGIPIRRIAEALAS